MRTAFTLALAALMCAVRVHAADPPRPDFTGSWLVDGVTTSGDEHAGGQGRHSGGGFGGGVGGFGRGGRGGQGGQGGRGREGGERPRGPVEGEPALTRGQHVEITQTETLLTVTIAPDAGGHAVRYPLDGSNGYTSAPDGTPLRTKTTWQGVALVTQTESTEKDRPFKARQVRTMDADGRVTIETTAETGAGKRTVTATLTKREI